MPKKKAVKKGAKIIDGVATNEMTREQLMGHVKRMQTELNREREERNFFMLEREKLYALWNITLEQLAGAKNEARLADVRMDDNEKERETEMQIYKQKLRYLLTEQSRKVTTVRLQNLNKMKAFQESTTSMECSMRDTIEKKNREISKTQTAIQNMMRQLQLENAENTSKLRADFCAELRRIESTFEKMLFEREESTRLHESVEIQRTAQEKSEHIHQMMKLHETQLKEIKAYFNEVMANNFTAIATLQDELAEMQEKEEELKQEVQKGRREYKKLESAILAEKEEAEKRVKEDRKCAQEIRKQLHQTDKRLKQNDKYTRVLEINNETLIQKAELAKKERDLLKDTLTKSIVEMQRKSNFQKLILETKLTALSHRKSGTSLSSGSSAASSGRRSSQSDADTISQQFPEQSKQSASNVVDYESDFETEQSSNSKEVEMIHSIPIPLLDERVSNVGNVNKNQSTTVL